MTAAQTAMMKLRGADSSGVPGEIAARVIEGVYQRQVPEGRVELLNNAMHWAYGTGLGIVYGLAQGTFHARTMRHGLAFGALVWGASLLQLPAMRLAPPVWEYPPQELAVDVGSHVVYGLGVAGAYAAASG
jgi:uncharacterized membrane protein YagU involved in acid resistance